MSIDTETITVEIDPRARETMEAMRFQVQATRATWSNHDPERVLNSAMSLGEALSQLSNWGNAKVFRDGDLSLLVITKHITFGLVGHRDFHADMPVEGDPSMGIQAPVLGRFCWTSRVDLEGGYCRKPIVRGEPTCEGHPPLIIATPIPIRWSYHS